MLYKHLAPLTARLFLAVALLIGLSTAALAAGANLLAGANGMDNVPYVDNPWGTVVNGIITLQSGIQFGVDEDGHVVQTLFSPSVAVGDLNGDGLPDLVAADARGYFWYFPNSGTPTQPKFTSGECMPIWIGDSVVAGDDRSLYSRNYDAMNNTVPRIQLVDYTGEKRLSIVAGNYAGKLFYIHNIGTSRQPNFSMPTDLSAITVNTYSLGKLWCNFLAPFLYDFTGNGRLDLIMGEGTYASNSIYRLVNKGNNGSPVFSETTTTKIIEGYGREHLNPQVVDWNNDGKPDIITGERQGFIDLYLNDSPDNLPAHLHFVNPPPPAPPNRIKFGYTQRIGLLTTVTVGDLNNNKLPNLVIANSDDRLFYAQNVGKLGEPRFNTPAPIKGVNPFPKIFAAPPTWRILKSFSMPYVLLASTNVRDDPTFKPPEQAPTIRSALKIYTVPHTHTYFPNEVYPSEDTHIIQYTPGTPLEAGTHYDFSFWAKTDGNVNNPRYFFACREWLSKQGINIPGTKGFRDIFIENNMDSGSAWIQEKGDVYVEKAVRDKTDVYAPQLFIAFNGNGGTLTVTGFTLTKRGN